MALRREGCDRHIRPYRATDRFRYAAKTIGLDADKDFTLIGAGTTAAMVPVIETGAVDAGMLTTPDFQSFMYRARTSIEPSKISPRCPT